MQDSWYATPVKESFNSQRGHNSRAENYCSKELQYCSSLDRWWRMLPPISKIYWNLWRSTISLLLLQPNSPWSRLIITLGTMTGLETDKQLNGTNNRTIQDSLKKKITWERNSHINPQRKARSYGINLVITKQGRSRTRMKNETTKHIVEGASQATLFHAEPLLDSLRREPSKTPLECKEVRLCFPP